LSQDKNIEQANSSLALPVERNSVLVADRLTRSDHALLRATMVSPDLLPASFKGPGDIDCEITDKGQRVAVNFRELEKINRTAWGFK